MKKILTILALTILPLCCWAGEQGYAVYDEATATLTFKYGEKPSGDNVYDTDDTSWDGPKWDRSVLKTVIFDPSYAKARPLSTKDWFSDASSLENIQGIEYLNTSEVYEMSSMFSWCEKLTELDLRHFDTHNVAFMDCMFASCTNLANLDISHFDTRNVRTMDGMFSGCEKLTHLDLSHFDTKKVEDMGSMFAFCSNLANLNVSSFNTSSVIDMAGMFYECLSLTNLDLRHFDTGNCEFISQMFKLCSSLTSLKLGKFGSKYVTSMFALFEDCVNLEELDFEAFETCNVTEMRDMFLHCEKLVSLDLRSFDTSNVENMSGMFGNCVNLTKLDISSFNPAKVTDMGAMFYWCANLKDLRLFKEKASSVTELSGLFGHCSSLTSLDMSCFESKKCQSTTFMFRGCEKLETLDLTHFDTSNVITMAEMFERCQSLKILDLSNFDTKNVLEAFQMFSGCESLERIYVSDIWDMSNAIHCLSDNSIYTKMFSDANQNLIGGAGTTYSREHIDNTYARIDGGPDNPGYLTAAFQEEGVTYSSKDDGVSVVHASVEESFVDIPSNVNDGNENLVVNTIGEGAFENKTDLKLVSFPETISEIGENAFAGCSSLSAIYCFAVEPITLGNANAQVRTRADGVEKSASTVFTAVDKESCVLYVPKNCRDKYRNAEGWAEFQNIEEMESDILGDANNDGEVDNKDLNAIADYILTEQAKNFIFMNADMNKDKTLNSVDIVHLVDKIKATQ